MSVGSHHFITVITAITVITKRREKSTFFGCGFDFSRTISGGGPGRRSRFGERAPSAGERRD